MNPEVGCWPVRAANVSSTPCTVLPRNSSWASATVSCRPRSCASSASTRLARSSLSTSTPSQSKMTARGLASRILISSGRSVLAGVQIDERYGAATQHVLRQHAIPFLHGFPLHQLGILFQRLGADLDGLGLGLGRQHLLPCL